MIDDRVSTAPVIRLMASIGSSDGVKSTSQSISATPVTVERGGAHALDLDAEAGEEQAEVLFVTGRASNVIQLEGGRVMVKPIAENPKTLEKVEMRTVASTSPTTTG